MTKKHLDLKINKLGLLDGLFKSFGKILHLAQKAEEAGGELQEERVLTGSLEKNKPWQAIFGWRVKTGLGLDKKTGIKKVKQN